MPERVALYSLLLLSAFSLSSCGKDGRAVTVLCKGGGENLAARFETPDLDGFQIGYISSDNFSPGTILELSSNHATGTSNLHVRYILRTTESDFLASKPEAWRAPIVAGALQILVDSDVDQAVKSVGISLEKEIGTHTALSFVRGGRRKTLRDSLTLVNSDRAAINAVKDEGENSRFLVIAAASYGRFEDLLYTGSALASVPGFLLNVSYTCADVERVTTLAKQSLRQATMVVFYIPIKYSQIFDRVDIDNQELSTTGLIPEFK